jgi:tRNA(fMet)-specific endonuclease VapC
MFLLDTNVLSETLRSQPDPGVMRGLKRHRCELSTAAPVIHEMLFGALRFPPDAKRNAVLCEIEHVFLKTLDVLPYDRRAAEWHARQRARLTDEGRTPPFVDGQTAAIAAIAAVNGLTLVTHNVTGFAAFEGLTVEDWFAS